MAFQHLEGWFSIVWIEGQHVREEINKYRYLALRDILQPSTDLIITVHETMKSSRIIAKIWNAMQIP